MDVLILTVFVSLLLVVGAVILLLLHPAAIVAGSEKIRSVLGWVPKHDNLDEIVTQALAWETSLERLKAAS